MEANLKSFDEYFSDKKIDNDDELDQWYRTEAKKVFNALKHPNPIKNLGKLNIEAAHKVVKDLDNDHSGLTMRNVIRLANEYADYRAKNQPETFDMYFDGYKYFDNGGKTDKQIIADAKKLYETLKTPEKIRNFQDYGSEAYADMEKNMRKQHLNITMDAVCQCAEEYADYAIKYCKHSPENDLSKSNNSALEAKIAEHLHGNKR